MVSKSYIYLRCGKHIKFTNSLIKYVNACKIPIILPNYQSLNPDLVLNYDTTNFLDLLLVNIKEDISPVASNNDIKRMKLADINNDRKDIRQIDIDKDRPATPN